MPLPIGHQLAAARQRFLQAVADRSPHALSYGLDLADVVEGLLAGMDAEKSSSASG